MTFKIEFPDYPAADMPAIPAGFEDTSWVNNSAPSFQNLALGLSIWIDYLDPAQREHEGERFMVNTLDADGAFTSDEPILATDDWNEVLAFIAKREVSSAGNAEGDQVMLVLYASPNESPTTMSLDQLLANFRSSGTRHWEEDIRNDLDGLGWYEGTCDYGRYLILNFAKMGLKQ